MADENKEIPEVSEFEAKLPAQSNNKDLWLFLIIVDVVFLCVFGFFLYKNLSVRLLSPDIPAKSVAPIIVQEEIALPEETLTVQEIAVVPTPQSVPVEQPLPVVPEKISSDPQPLPSTDLAEADKKESVIVKTNPKSKYRQVTFRYFGEGKNVAVVSGFTMAKPRAMNKKDGVWQTTLSIAPGTYKYLFVVDGVQIPDPYAEEKDGRSVLVLP